MSAVFNDVQNAAERLWLSLLQGNPAVAANEVLAENVNVDLHVTVNGVTNHVKFIGRDEFIVKAQKIAQDIILKLAYSYKYTLNENEHKITTIFENDFVIKNQTDPSVLNRMRGKSVIEMTYALTEDKKIIFTKYVNHENDTVDLKPYVTKESQSFCIIC